MGFHGIRLLGYLLTGLGATLWNVRAFFAGLVPWFAVVVMWKDKAIMVVHVVAFVSVLVGYLNT